LHGQLPLPPLDPDAVQIIVRHKGKVMQSIAKLSILTERQKSRITCPLARKQE
jgi:hypothetical protein